VSSLSFADKRLLVICVVTVLYLAKAFFLPVVTAFIVGTMLSPAAGFLERYRVAYANEMAHFIDAVAGGKPVRTTIADGVKALELADAATRSWRERRIVEL